MYTLAQHALTPYHTASEGLLQLNAQDKQSSWLPANLSMPNGSLVAAEPTTSDQVAVDSHFQGGIPAVQLPDANDAISHMLCHMGDTQAAANLSMLGAVLQQQQAMGPSTATMPAMGGMPGIPAALHLAALSAAAQCALPQVALQLPQMDGKNMTLPGGSIIQLPDSTSCKQTGPIILTIPQVQHVAMQPVAAALQTPAVGMSLDSITSVLSADPTALHAMKQFLNIAATAILRAEGQSVDPAHIPDEPVVQATFAAVHHLLPPALRDLGPRRAFLLYQQHLAAAGAAGPQGGCDQGRSDQDMADMLLQLERTTVPKTPRGKVVPRARGRPCKAPAVAQQQQQDSTLAAALSALSPSIVTAMQIRRQQVACTANGEDAEGVVAMVHVEGQGWQATTTPLSNGMLAYVGVFLLAGCSRANNGGHMEDCAILFCMHARMEGSLTACGDCVR